MRRSIPRIGPIRIVQQTFLKVIEILDKIERPKCPQTRSLRVIIAGRKMIDLYRKRKRHTTMSLEDDQINVYVRSEMDTFEEHSILANAKINWSERIIF